MTREDAAREIDNTACCFSDKRFRDAMHMAAAALRGPQADPDNGVPTVKESLTTEPTQIDRIKKLEKEVEQLKKYFERFARFNRLGLPEVEV